VRVRACVREALSNQSEQRRRYALGEPARIPTTACVQSNNQKVEAVEKRVEQPPQRGAAACACAEKPSAGSAIEPSQTNEPVLASAIQREARASARAVRAWWKEVCVCAQNGVRAVHTTSVGP